MPSYCLLMGGNVAHERGYLFRRKQCSYFALTLGPGIIRFVASIPTTLQRVLGILRAKLSGQTEDAYRERDAAEGRGDFNALSYAAGEAHAYGKAEDSVRNAQRDADE